MTPEQALEILAQATAELPMKRGPQLQVMEALRLLQEIVKKSTEVSPS